MSDHETLVALHEAWRRENETKRVRERESFRRSVARKQPVLYRKLLEHPKMLAELPLNIQNDWRGIRRPVIGEKTLERYLPMLAEGHLQEARSGSRESFEEFLNRILQACGSEEELKQYLQSERLPSR